MRKMVIAILAIAFIVGCGVSKDEYIRVVNELEKAKEEISQLKGKIEKLKVNVEILSENSKEKRSLKWEYKIVKISSGNEEEQLNEYGKEGWELIDIILLSTCIYKRPLN
jgi:Tfp pilus assembly protein PilO